MKIASILFASLLVFSGSSFAKETPHYEVVQEFVRELADAKQGQDVAAADMVEVKKIEGAEKNQEMMLSLIRNSTRIKLKIRTNIAALKNMSLNKPDNGLIPAIIFWNEKKLKLWDEMGNTAKAFIGGVKPNVDYSKLTARSPEITAELEYADESLFNLISLVFMTLIDHKPDSKNHLSHLIITKEQGDNLVNTLNIYFGASLDEKNQNWTITTASVLRSYLSEKGYKYADEPWE